MRKVAIVISGITRAAAFESIADPELLRDFELTFILLNPAPTPLEDAFRRKGCKARFVRYRSKKDLPRAVRELARIFREDRPDVVHTHLQGANLAGLAAARLCGIPRRIHTRHHSDPYHHHHRHARLYDACANLLSTEIVAASDNVADVLTRLESVPASKIRKIPFGIRIEDYDSVTPGRIEEMKSRYGALDRGPIVGMVSRYLEIKGLQYAIPAFKELLREHPQALLLIANANGPYQPRVRELLADLPPASFREIRFEAEMPALYRAMDVFVHVPTDPVAEAFGQAYTEALAAKLPAVFTLSGVAREFAQDGRNSLVVPFRDSGAITRALRSLLDQPELARALAQRGHEDVRRLFGHAAYLEAHRRLFS